MDVLRTPGSSLTSYREPAPGWWAAGSLILAVLAAAPLFTDPGFLNTRGGGDSPFLLFRLQQLYTALAQGIFPVRWMPDAAFGLGYPFFNYYAGLPYYGAAAFHAFGFSYVSSLKLIQLAGFVLAAVGMYGWIHRLTGRASAGFLASAAYTFAPFHLVNVYVRGDSLSEFWAMAWYPLILWAVLEVALEPSTRRVGLLALAYAALAMTHNISALIFSPFVAIYALGCAFVPHPASSSRSGAWLRLAALAAGGILGLALSAWVWLPALGEQDYVQLGTQTTGYFFYGNHFRSATLVQPGFLFNYDTGSEDATPFSMGLVQAIVSAAASLVLVARMIRRRRWWYDGFLLFGLLLSTLMITPHSKPLWQWVPLLSFAQFPWRFLSVQALFTSAVIARLTPWPDRTYRVQTTISRPGEPLPQEPFYASLPLIPTGLAAVMAAAGFGALHLNFIPLNDEDVTPQRLQWYESFSGNIGTTIRYEYLPHWTSPRPYSSDVLLERDPHAKFLVGAGTSERTSARAASQTWTISVTSRDARIAIPVLYWPGWQAEIDGRWAPITPVDGLGYIQLDATEGTHSVRLWLDRTGMRLWAEIVSLAAVAVAVAVLHPSLPRWDWVEWALASATGVLLVASSMVLHSLPDPGSLPGPLNADFSQEAYFHRSPDGIGFSDGTRLLDWEPPVWVRAAPDAALWRLAPPPQQAEQGAVEIPRSGEPGWHSAAPGLYFLNLQREDADALTSVGERRGPIYLEPSILLPGTTLPDEVSDAPASFGPISLVASDTQTSPGSLDIWLLWTTSQEVGKNYAIALRLVDEAGNEWGALDTQAGSAGMYPTGLWRPGEYIPDQYQLRLPAGTPPGVYTLRITLYDAVTLVAIGQTERSGVPYNHIESYRCPPEPQGELLFSGIGIDHVSTPEEIAQGSALPVEIGWFGTSEPDERYEVMWQLVSNSQVIWESQSPLAPGSDPRDWVGGECGAYVLGRHRLELPGSVPPGDYQLTLQLVTEEGDPVGDEYTAGQVSIGEIDRVFDVPPLEATLNATFGNTIILYGYTLQQGVESLTIDVAWGALVDPAADYKFFVHLYDPATEQIVSQIDAMPRGYIYPTSQWTAGEVIAEELVLDLSDVPPGNYWIALGWYDPVSGTRLTALNGQGETLPNDRVILPGNIEIP